MMPPPPPKALLTAGYRGQIFCGNASTLLCGGSQWQQLGSWFDRVVKYVLIHLDLTKYHEYWLPAEQRRADELATFAIPNVNDLRVPWTWVVGYLDDTPRSIRAISF